METQKYYKVVFQANGYYSAIVSKKPWRVRYRVGKWVHPPYKETPLLVFETLVDAMAFSRNDPLLPIWECEVQGARPVTVIPYWSTYWPGSSEAIRQAWNLAGRVDPGGTLPFELSRTPRGTVACDAVKLIQPVFTEVLQTWED